MSYLERINSPADLKKLDLTELKAYAAEVREYIVDVVGKRGGHLASNLGAVELTIAMHYVFDCPKDKFIFDVGHQSYTHKIITGRRDAFRLLRTDGGISGFENMSESEYDAFTTGHSSTSLSVGLGLARARDLKGDKYDVVSVIGDGAFTGGMTYEALNDIGASGTRIIMILNDNAMSISRNVGAISSYFGKLRLSRRYKVLKTKFKRGVNGIPLVGPALVRLTERAKNVVKRQVLSVRMFEQLGIKYYGAFDGHDIGELVYILRQIRTFDVPVLLHVVTRKGSGFYEAEHDPVKYHGVTGAPENTLKFSDIVSRKLVEMGKRDDRIVCASAAMLPSTGLEAFGREYPDRCYDVGIAEQHAVSMCAGMAAAGMKPYFAVYSTFLQRGFDQLLHDVGINGLPVRFLIDRAGVAGSDGVTHQGLYDICYLTAIPGMCVMAPRNGKDLEKMLEWSANYDGGPLAIRYPKGYTESSDDEPSDIEYGKWEILSDAHNGVYVLAVGPNMTELASRSDCCLISARFVKPLDTELLRRISGEGNLIITLEENSLRGGFGESVLSELNAMGAKCAVKPMGFGDKFCDCRSAALAYESNGLTEKRLDEVISAHISEETK